MSILTPEQLNKLSEISNPLVRRRFAVFYQLPPDLQESMLAENTASSIWNLIKEKYYLQETSVSATAKIIGLIFLGELAIKDFITALKNELNVGAETAKAIAQDINLAIFQPVRESLMAVHGITSDANTRIHPNDTNSYQSARTQPATYPHMPTISPPKSLAQKIPMTNSQFPNKSQTPMSKQIPNNLPPAPYNLRPNNGNIKDSAPYQARPISYRVPLKNIVDLRKLKRKSRSNGFFS